MPLRLVPMAKTSTLLGMLSTAAAALETQGLRFTCHRVVGTVAAP